MAAPAVSEEAEADESVPPALTAGAFHTCMISDGQVLCWGSNASGQLGDGTTVDKRTPVAVVGISTATSVSAGGSTTCAGLEDGTLRCWGSNDGGALGNGSSVLSSALPVAVDGIVTARSVSVGADWQRGSACAVLLDGGVRCWGHNEHGQLGDDTTQNRSLPVPVQNLTAVREVAVGGSHACALTTQRRVMCWGSDSEGQLGNDAELVSSTTPVPVRFIAAATSVSAGARSACATARGLVQCWGSNLNGELGAGTSEPRSSLLVNVSGITDSTHVAGDSNHYCTSLAGGTVWCWGSNTNGQLGSKPGLYAQSSVPLEVEGLPSGASSVAVGMYHSCTVLVDDGVMCWGSNTYGQLGDGTLVSSVRPVEAVGLP